MQIRRKSGAGITWVFTVTLGGKDRNILPETGPAAQRSYRLALQLDREAGTALFHGRFLFAEYMAHRAAEMRNELAV